MIITLSLTRQERPGNMLHSNRHGAKRVGKSGAGNSWPRTVHLQGSLLSAFMKSIHLRRSFNKRIMTLAGPCIVLALLFFISPTRAQAQTVTSGPSFQVNAGFETRYQDGNWIPVQVSLRNDGPDFSGSLSLKTPNPQFMAQSNPSSPSNYQVPITLANGAQKQVTMYVPLYFDVQSVTVKLLDSSGKVVGSQTATLNPLMPGDILVGILSDQSSGFGPLSAAPLPNQGGSVITEFLNASTMPSFSTVLKNFNVIVLDNFTTSNLSAAQLTALQTWVVHGGALIIVGGPEWHRTISPLPERLVPVTVYGTTTIPAGTSLLPLGGSRTGRPGQDNMSYSVRSRVTISTATPMTQGDPGKSEVVLTTLTSPLIVQAQQGQGTTIYLAYDPTLEPIFSWHGAGSLWENLLIRSLGDRLLSHLGTSPVGNYSGGEQPLLAYRMSSLLQSLLPGTIPSPWSTLAILFAGYILVLSLVRFLLVKRLKRRDWSWRIVLSSIVIFSLLSYGIAYKEKGTSILSNSITIAQLGQNGSSASITSYLGVFVPNEGDFQVHIPGNGLVQPSPDNISFSQSGSSGPTEKSPTTIAPAQGGTDVNLQDVNIWTLHAILSEQDRQIHKGLASQLTLQNGALMGTVTNTLGYGLSDSYLLMSNQVFGLGHLAAGETKKVQFKVSNIPLDPNATLADLIAPSSGSLGPYDFIPASQSRSERQRHLAILFALDGEGFYVSSSPTCIGQCNPPVSILPVPLGINSQPIGSSSAYNNNTNVITTPSWPYTSTRDSDPLLVPGSPVTFIGWAQSPLDSTDNVTVNDINPAGLHETLIQAPLNVNLAGSLDLPPNYIAGRLVDIEGNSAQIQFPGVYTISTGSMTFEFNVPDIANLQVNGLTLTEPPNINLFAQVGTVLNAGALPFYLYNWHTQSWDAISFNQSTYTFATNNVSAYIGADGRILLQLANKNSSLSTFAFGKPSLNLQGYVLGNMS